MDEDGYVFVMARTDDVINVAGHRLSTGSIEEVMATHPDVAECAVFGAADKLKGQLPVGLVVLKAGVDRPQEEIVKEVVKLVRDSIGAVAAFKTAVVVDRLPKTRSGQDPARDDAQDRRRRGVQDRRRRSTIPRSSARSGRRCTRSATPRRSTDPILFSGDPACGPDPRATAPVGRSDLSIA